MEPGKDEGRLEGTWREPEAGERGGSTRWYLVPNGDPGSPRGLFYGLSTVPHALEGVWWFPPVDLAEGTLIDGIAPAQVAPP